MKVITQMEHTKKLPTVAVALGTFDGIHLGHQKVIGRAVELARQEGGKSAVFTFANHPLSILDPSAAPRLITGTEEKERLLMQMGVDLLYRVPFDAKLLQLTPFEFIDTLFLYFSPTHIVVGPNYSFGYRGQGTPELLRQIGNEKGFNVEVQNAVFLAEQMVSSTSIRQCISQGNIELAARLMGRPFHLSGTVISGDRRGRTIGFPTANLQLEPDQLLPADGVYAVFAWVGSRKVLALANVGNNPTFANQTRRLEVHLLDFDADLYGQELAIDFCRYMRGEQAYPSIHELQERIALDVLEVRRFFDGNKF